MKYVFFVGLMERYVSFLVMRLYVENNRNSTKGSLSCGYYLPHPKDGGKVMFLQMCVCPQRGGYPCPFPVYGPGSLLGVSQPLVTCPLKTSGAMSFLGITPAQSQPVGTPIPGYPIQLGLGYPSLWIGQAYAAVSMTLVFSSRWTFLFDFMDS